MIVMENKILSEKESLDLITQMIRETQQNTARYAAYPLLIWGYTTAIISILIWLGISVFNLGYQIQYFWFALPVIALPLTFYYLRKDSRKGSKNYMERITGEVWMVMGIGGGVLGVIAFFQSFNILFVVSILMAMATTLSGLIMKFKPLTVCGIVTMCISLVLLFVHSMDCLLIFAAIFIVMMVIPGHIFNKKQKESC